MKITDRYFSFPPHLIVPWEQVSCLQSELLDSDQARLIVHLTSGHQIVLPVIEIKKLDAVFDAYQQFQDNRQQLKIRIRAASQLAPAHSDAEGFSLAMPLPILQNMATGASSFEQFARNLRHNPEMKDLPALPKDLLARIAHTARLMFTGEESSQLPQPHPGCHCMYCQIARAIQGGLEQASEPISEEDLRLSQWHIQIIGDDHYLVVNTVDPSQQHEVHLKPKVTCSCGQEGCAHVQAVLRS